MVAIGFRKSEAKKTISARLEAEHQVTDGADCYKQIRPRYIPRGLQPVLKNFITATLIAILVFNSAACIYILNFNAF